MEILLDTNFILNCVKNKIELEEFEEEFNEETINWIVPEEVIEEIRKVSKNSKEKKRDREIAEISLEIVSLLEPKIISLGTNDPNIDNRILKHLSGKKIVLATMDKGLKKRTNNKILTIRAKKKLEFL